MATFVITPLPASCPRCGCIDTFEFRRRQTANYWRVSRQCRVCGQTDDSGVRNADLPGRHTYPLFDPDLADRWQAEHWAEARAERVREWEARRADYAAWLATDSELRDLRTRVLKRDHYLCAACLVRRAFQVHHRTYAFGRLP